MAESIGYQIFDTEAEFNTHKLSIHSLLNIPNPDTTMYREKIKHYSLNEWGGKVTQELVDACLAMTPAQRLTYYDEINLVSVDYLDANGWNPLG